jgi:phosphatidylserine decarboxylase
MRDESTISASAGDRLRAVAQHLLPHRLLTWIMYRLTRVRFAPWKDRQIRWFIRRYGVDLEEAANGDPTSYPHFNAFFTRELRAGSRRLEGGDETIACPADGRVSAIGTIHAGTVFQAKGRDYSVAGLLGGGDAPGDLDGGAFDGGSFATIYLSPRDYHRVHMPTGGRLRETRYIPGRLFSGSVSTARTVDRLFARNERLVCLFDTAAGPMALILVGAMLVAGMETVWSGPVTPPHGQPARTERFGDARAELERGQEMGRFNTGSTVIVLFPGNRVRWSDELYAGSGVRMGQAIGTVLAAGATTGSASAAEG